MVLFQFLALNFTVNVFFSRCPTDNTVLFHSTSNSRQRFSLQAFKYLQNSTAVFLHCLVFLCHSTSTDYRCQYGCAGNNIHRGKRDIGEEREDGPSSTYMIDIQVNLKEEGISTALFIPLK